MAVKISNQQKWRPWKGIVLFFVAAAWIIGGSIFAEKVGIAGNFVTQAGLLITAIATCFFNKTPLKEVFPIKKITVRDFFGALFMWIGGLGFGMASIYIAGMIFPEMYEAVTGGLGGIISGTTIILAFLLMVVCPPICEEAICRGAILSTFRGIKKDWVIILIVGIMFGALHMDPIRFVNTAILGSVCAYLVVKRNNFILATFVHLCNNFLTGGIAIISSAFDPDALSASSDAASAAAQMPAVASLGSIMATFFFAPVALVIGMHLIKRQKEISEGSEKKSRLAPKLIVAAILSVLILAGGIALNIMYNPLTKEALESLSQTAILAR
ncbi:MAG: CPBP family intramembrane metalloprotease [Clostridiales bacterium]|nr:CPBP family intramembrane metalloprotease [Clostridiales bacterium]